MASRPLPIFTIEQYLKLEREAPFRSEYIKGEMVAMSGGSRDHALLGTAIAARLDTQLGDKPCAVAANDLRLCCLPEDVLTYPDVVVYCEPASHMDDDEDTLTDAVVIVEVLSKSTRRYDRIEKFRYYRSLPSFSEYLLVEQDEIRAEHHFRQPDGSWAFRVLTTRADIIQLDSIWVPTDFGRTVPEDQASDPRIDPVFRKT